MPENSPLKPAAELAAKNKLRFPNESPEYRRARQALLAEEIEVRRHIERLAAQRRALPPGGEVNKPYSFQGEQGPATFAARQFPARDSTFHSEKMKRFGRKARTNTESAKRWKWASGRDSDARGSGWMRNGPLRRTC